MDRTRPAPAAGAAAPSSAAAASAAALARGALRRLAQAQLEPTPENYAQAYAEEAGTPPPGAGVADALTTSAASAADGALKSQGQAWAALLERATRNLERGGREWTQARRKDSLQRVLGSNRTDPTRLQQRLTALMSAWETDRPADPLQTGLEAAEPSAAEPSAAELPAESTLRDVGPPADWPPLWEALEATVQAGLPPGEVRAAELAAELAVLSAALGADGLTAANLTAVQSVCERARRLFGHRHHLIEELGSLCRELALGLTEMAEEDSWTRIQCERLQLILDGDGENGGGVPSVRGARAAIELLAETRERHKQIKSERDATRESLKNLIQSVVGDAGELGDEADRFQNAMSAHARAIQTADSLESLAGVVRTMLDEGRSVQAAVSATRERLKRDQLRAQELQLRVDTLENELRRMSDEAATDALTQVANRRGMALAFAALAEGCLAHPQERPEGQLAVGLLDIDNFKRLNDSLGHAAGDEALKSLAAAVQARLRPGDHIARFGGEEFVVLLPSLALDDAQQALTRLQRSLSASLFMHEGKDVFVTFSAGVTAWRRGEPLEVALERADEALYEAKSSGKNRTCAA